MYCDARPQGPHGILSERTVFSQSTAQARPTWEKYLTYLKYLFNLMAIDDGMYALERNKYAECK